MEFFFNFDYPEDYYEEVNIHYIRKAICISKIIFYSKMSAPPEYYWNNQHYYNYSPNFYGNEMMMMNNNFYQQPYLDNNKNINNNNNYYNKQNEQYYNKPFIQHQQFNNGINNTNNFQKEDTFKPAEHLRGLVNIANTCYMNSIIQCFAHIKELFTYFEKPKIMQLMSAPENNQKLAPVFSSLIIALWFPYDPSPLYPYIFKERLGKMNPLFAGAMPNDAKDLLTFLLMQLHEELNNPKSNSNNQSIIPNIEMQKNKKEMRNYFAKYFRENYRSIISGLFYGLNYNETQCLSCNITLYNFQTFNFLIFPLFEVLNYKMKLVNNQTNFNYTVTLEDCFKYNQIYSPLNEYYCNACKRNSKGKYATFLSVLPNILIIILNRGAGLQYKVKIDFDENLDLKNYVELFKEDSFYELMGVITHYGESGISGHFMARCKSPLDTFWYLYNDAIVQKIEYFTKEKFLQGNPYILFYRKTKFQK